MKADPARSLFCARLFLQGLWSGSLSVTNDCRPRSVERAWVVDSEVHLKLFAVIDQLEPLNDMQLCCVRQIIGFVDKRLIVSAVHVYAKDFGKNEVALARYLRGVGFKALQRT